KAVVEAVLIQVEYASAGAVGGIDRADPAGVAFRSVEGVLAIEREAHEHAAPILGVLRFVLLFSGRHKVADQAVAALVAIEESQRKSLRTAVGRHDGLTAGADGQTERARPGDVLHTQRSDNSAARQDAGRPRTADRGPHTRRRR